MALQDTFLNYGDGPRAIYEALKERIISGELPAGSELKIMPLANELGVSIVPVREAIRILAAEDLIELRPRRSPVIAKLDQRDLVEINRIRRALEPLVLDDAVGRHSEGTLARCKVLLDEDRTCTDLWQKVELNKEFHLALLAPSVMRRTISIIADQYVGMTRITHVMVMKHPEMIDAHDAEHEAVFEAVRTRETARAVSLMEKHIDRATERVGALLEEDGESGERMKQLASP